MLTAGDGNWPGKLAWTVVGETADVMDWEHFRILQPLPSMIVNFDDCDGVTKTLGNMDAIQPGSNSLMVSYKSEEGRGCVARLEYDVADWSAFRIPLMYVDLIPYEQLVFDIKADPQHIPEKVKIELKRAGGQEVSILDISGITTEWQTMSVNLSDFGPTEFAYPLSSFTTMEELLFTFDLNRSGKEGVIFLDNVALR
jgi:hypothetical protein